MSKLAAIMACAAMASVFSFDAMALPGSSAPSQSVSSEVTQVRGFCGLGFHRGPYGNCVPNGVYYAPPVVVAPMVVAPPPVVVAPRACPWGYGYAPAYGRCVPL